MRKLKVLLLTVFACVPPCFGLTRQEKDRLVNRALAHLMNGQESADDKSQVLEVDELAFLMFSDALAARVTSTEPKQNDLIDKYLSQCDEIVLRRIAFMEAHPSKMGNFWRECWQKAAPEDRQELLKGVTAYIQAVGQVKSVFGNSDQLVALAEQWHRAGATEASLNADHVYAPLARFVEAYDLLEVFVDLSDEEIVEKYFSDAQETREEKSEWLTLMVVAVYLVGKTSLQALELVLQEAQAAK